MQQRKPFPIERRPTMLKDFLDENSNSSSSSGFKSFPRKPRNPSVQTSIKHTADSSNNMSKLLRCRSKAASTTISSAFQAMIKAVKKLPFATAVNSPSILPRSLSRRLSKKSSEKKENEIKITVRVKDIMRWTSFRDLVQEKSPPLDFVSSPCHYTTTTTTTRSSSNGSSWCESDFTSEYGENEVDVGKKYLPCVGRDCMEATTGTETYTAVGPKGELPCDEKEQHSPISVLDFQLEEDEEPSSSSYAQSLANMESTTQNLMQKIQHFESLAKLEPFNLEEYISLEESTSFQEEEEEEEEHEFGRKARELFNHVKATSEVGSCKTNVDEQLLLDFFWDELNTKRFQTKKEADLFDCELVSIAKAWMSGEHNGLYEVGVEDKREACITDMDRVGGWSKFEEEQGELALEIETGVLGYLVDELLVDLFLH